MLKNLIKISPIIVITLIAAFFLFGKNSNGSSETVKVRVGEAVKVVYATGVVEPVSWAKLGVSKNGRIMKIMHDEGDAVKEGDVIAMIDNHVEEAKLLEAQARVDFLRKDISRKKELLSKGVINQRQFDDTDRDLQESEARVASIAREMEDLKIISPVEGVVIRRDVELGETVQAGEDIFWVGKLIPLRLTAEVDEEDIGELEIGQKAVIKADAFPGKVFEGTVSEITPKGDPVNKVFRIRIALPDDSPLLISMTVEVNIITREEKSALLIPAKSEINGKVWKKDGLGFKEVPVKIGIKGENESQVIEGLSEGDEILSSPPDKK